VGRDKGARQIVDNLRRLQPRLVVAAGRIDDASQPGHVGERVIHYALAALKRVFFSEQQVVGGEGVVERFLGVGEWGEAADEEEKFGVVALLGRGLKAVTQPARR